MRIAGLNKNDVVNGEGVCVSLFMQGCHFHCKGCHNLETWDFKGGREIDKGDLIKEIIEAISANGIQRNFSILGGEPFAPQNRFATFDIVSCVRKTYPNIKIFIWTGYTCEDLANEPNHSLSRRIFEKADFLIDGPFIEEERDITLPLRGSRNQRIINLREYERLYY